MPLSDTSQVIGDCYHHLPLFCYEGDGVATVRRLVGVAVARLRTQGHPFAAVAVAVAVAVAAVLSSATEADTGPRLASSRAPCRSRLAVGQLACNLLT